MQTQTLSRTFAPALRDHRKRAGISQLELGRLAGVGPTQISQYETGDALPSLPVFLGLCHALRCSPLDLLPREGDR
jgi:transcriptional regulator with XRE-family HTH domain